jgi:heavy metal sensor kinase
MSGQSIRTRLTLWYLTALALVALTLGLGSSWLMQRSLVAAADAALRSRVDGVVQFIDAMERKLGVDEMRDEIREYAELAAGQAGLEVTELGGDVVYRPATTGWAAMAVDRGGSSEAAPLIFADRLLGQEPMRVADMRAAIGHRTYHIIAALPMAPAYDALARFRWLLAALVPAVLVAAGLGGYGISRRALAPVDRMARAAQAVTVKNLDHRLEVPPADDELRRLAVTFNDMLARLQAAVAEMTRLTAEASHELRTPVALIRATAEVAIGRDRPAADYKQALADVLDHAERMSTLVGDLLMLARSDAGVEPSERVSLDLRQVVRDATEDMRAAMTRAELALTVELPDRAVEMVGNPDSLRRLIVILLDNARKYTKAGGAVCLRLAARPADAPGAAVIDLVDTGIGIDAADRPHVFDRFYRGAAARQQSADGSGLGLAIAKTIVERHGGTIALGDGPGGCGCEARITLPY